MFHHVLVRPSEYPSFARGHAPPGLLSPREEALLEGIELVPRRRKWLLGRAAAKALVRSLCPPPAPAPTQISVLNRPSGEPFVLVEGDGEWRVPLSLSHRSEAGLAVAPVEAKRRIGADIETVEPRAAALVRQFFTDREAEMVRNAPGGVDMMVTRIWSAKEAVLKLLGVGLRLDTRRVVVEGDGHDFPGCPSGWSPLAVTVATPPPGVLEPRDLRVVWRSEPGHVLTVAWAT